MDHLRYDLGFEVWRMRAGDLEDRLSRLNAGHIGIDRITPLKEIPAHRRNGATPKKLCRERMVEIVPASDKNGKDTSIGTRGTIVERRVGLAIGLRSSEVPPGEDLPPSVGFAQLRGRLVP